MNNDRYSEGWLVRYIQLHITVQWQDNCIVPMHKESAFRGSMGEYLLRQNCISDRQCEACSFEEDCIVRKIFYAKYKIVPPAVQTESAGFVIYCSDTRRQLQPGDRSTLELTLFGNVLLYFSQVLNALYAMGCNGIFTSCARYDIVKITTRNGDEILQRNDIRMDRYVYEYLKDYVSERRQQLYGGDSLDEERRQQLHGTDGTNEGRRQQLEDLHNQEENPEISGKIIRLRFESPAAIKYKNELMKEFNEETVLGVLNSIVRRVKMYLNYEGIPAPDYMVGMDDYQYLGAASQYASYFRHSSKEKERQPLRGVIGTIDLLLYSEELYQYLLAGEVLHIGKSTKFGMGKYHVDIGMLGK